MSRTGFAKNRQRGRDAMQHTPDIDVDHSIPLIHLQLVQQRKRHESGIADKHIEPTEPLLRSADECSEIRTLGDIDRHRFCLAAIATDLGGESFEPVEAARTKHHRSSAFRKMFCCRLADSAARARDSDHLAIESRHSSISSFVNIGVQEQNARRFGCFDAWEPVVKYRYPAAGPHRMASARMRSQCSVNTPLFTGSLLSVDAVNAAFQPAEGLTAAFVVTWKGRLIAERYAEGLTADAAR